MWLSSKTTVVIAVSAGLICLLVYLRALGCDFVNFDDTDFVLNNAGIRQQGGKLLTWAFTTTYTGFWMPLTWISFAVDYHFWELNPVGYHLTNILLHAANTGLVVMIADRLYRKALPETASAPAPASLYPAMLLLAGLLFGIHPLRVESVAWATERKDVLNGVFSLGSILCYLRYVQKKEAADKMGAIGNYLLSFVLFSCSLMAKQVSVVLPVMLLVADWYPLGRLRKGNILPLLAEKIPFLVLSAGVSAVTFILAVNKNLLVSASNLPLAQRFVVSGNAVFEYCRLMLLPVGIIPLHILPTSIPASFAVKTVVAAAMACCCFYAGRRFRFVPAAFFSFLLPLLPVLGFFQNGAQAYAARYTYLSSVGLSIVAAALIASLYQKSAAPEFRFKRFVIVALVAALLVFHVGMTEAQIDIWKNSGNLWSRVIAHQPLGRAFKSRGAYYLETGNDSAAINDFSAAIEIASRDGRQEDVFNLFAGRGAALGNMGRYEESVNDFSKAIELYPHPTYFYHRGLSWQAMGRLKEADEDFSRAGTERGPIKWFELKKD